MGREPNLLHTTGVCRAMQVSSENSSLNRRTNPILIMKYVTQRGLGHVDEDNAAVLAVLDIVCDSAKQRGKTQFIFPVNQAGYTFATDNIIAVRVGLIPGHREDSRVDIARQPWNPSIQEWPFIGTTYQPIPKLPDPKQTRCLDCDDATGRKTCRYCHNEGECKSCNGTGRVTEAQPIPIGENHVSDYYLRMIMRFPNPEIGTSKKLHPIPFRFTGGHGLIQPMRPKPC